MSDNGTIEIAGMAVSPEQARNAMDTLKAVNLDEVSIEMIELKVRHYKEEAVTDEEGQPLFDEEDQPLVRRKPSLRTAHIQNIVPVDVYHEAMALGSKGGSEAEAISAMTDIVLKIWQITEPRMSRKALVDGIGFEGIAALAGRFFDKLSRL